MDCLNILNFMKMKRILNFCFLLVGHSFTSFGQTCVANYSYTGVGDTYSFSNSSTVSNPHHYWNFGDGDGSNAISPLHTFPDDGEYLVTLYCHDTISGCSSFNEKRISVNKPDTVSCNLLFKDTIIGTNYLRTNLTTSCLPFYSLGGDAGPCSNLINCYFSPTWGSSLFISKFKIYHAFQNPPYNTIAVYKEYFKTVKYNYSPAISYQNCSSNFEVTVNYQSSGAVVNFVAMNKKATNYDWVLNGVGSINISSTPVVNHFFPYPPSYEKSRHYIMTLVTLDTINNCIDTVTQNILIKNLNYTVFNGISEFRRFQFSVFPNPAQEKIIFEFELNTEIDNITIVSTLGVELFRLLKPLPYQELNIANLSKGIYFLRAESKQGQSVFKFLKE